MALNASNANNKTNYTKNAAFINRKNEMQFLHDHIAKEPENMLFIYGPKSSGKTTLLYKLVETLQTDTTKKYNIKHFNLRKITIDNYSDFLRSFFITDTNKEIISEKTVKNARSLDFKFFSITHEEEKLLLAQKADPFLIMEVELQKLNAKNIRPIVIIDELQALEGIYMNGQKELLKEIFNFFVAMTKESHLCHVFIASSDGYFIERIYEDSKLKKTSTFFEVAYLSKEDTFYWLNNLEKESAIKNYVLDEEQKKQIWHNFGGSCWEVSNFLGEIQNGAKKGTVPQDVFEQILKKYLIMQRSKFENYARSEKRQKMFVAMNELFNKNHSIKFVSFLEKIKDYYDDSTLSEELQILVTKNILSFDPTTAEYALQGRSMEIGLEMFAKMLTV